MFSHNGTNGPESKTTRMFRPVCQVAAPGGGKDGWRGGEYAVPACILFNHVQMTPTLHKIVFVIVRILYSFKTLSSSCCISK